MNKVLHYPVGSNTHGTPDMVFGQPDFASGSANQGLGSPTAQTLSGPRGVDVTSTGAVYVADTSNHRVVHIY